MFGHHDRFHTLVVVRNLRFYNFSFSNIRKKWQKNPYYVYSFLVNLQTGVFLNSLAYSECNSCKKFRILNLQ